MTPSINSHWHPCTKNDIIRFRKERHAQYVGAQATDRPKPLTETTVNRDIEVIRHLLFWAADEGFIPTNPIARVHLVRERRRRRPVLPVADELKLLAACSPHLRPIVITALDTGMRRGELLNQAWGDVDFDRRVISVSHSKTAEGEHRLVPMTARVYELLSQMGRIAQTVFTYEGLPIRRIKTGWAGALRRASLPHYRFHDLRHTFNSRLADLGVIADVRKELMGHSRGGDVNSIYTHLELPTLREAIHRLEVWRDEKTRATEAFQTEAAPSMNQQPIEPKDSKYDETE